MSFGSSPPSFGNASIFVSDLQLLARVGVNPGEQGAPQPIVVDICVGVEDMELAARSEKLEHTLDYVGLARAAREAAEQRHYPLVESLASAIARAVLSRPGATWSRVRVRKLHCLRRASAAGVEVEVATDQLTVRPVPLEPGSVVDPEEIVVVGGGVAGLCTALWCQRLGHAALLLDPGPDLGGQLHLVHGLMPDLPGMDPLSGPALCHRLWRQLVDQRGRWLRGSLRAVRQRRGLCLLEAAGEAPGERGQASKWERTLSCKATILALGLRRRELAVPGERELAGRGLLDTAARGAEQQAGRRVVVVGGGDAACENALILFRAGARVTLVHRGPALSAMDRFVTEVQRESRITVRLRSKVRRFVGQDRLQGVQIHCPQGRTVLPADAALVRIGWVPNSEVLPASWLDRQGFVRAGIDARVEGEKRFFAAGDIVGPLSPSVAFAFGSGATAARAAALLLEGRRHQKRSAR